MTEVGVLPAYKREYSLTQLGHPDAKPEGGDNNGNTEENSGVPQGFIAFVDPNATTPDTSSPSKDNSNTNTNTNTSTTANESNKDLPAPLKSSPSSSPSASPPQATKDTPTKEKKMDLFGFFRKKFQKSPDSNVVTPASPPPQQQENTKRKSTNAKPSNQKDAVVAIGGGATGADQPNLLEAERRPTEEKRVMVISSIEELPEDCQKLIRHAGIPPEKLTSNLRILLRVLHFRTGAIYKMPEELDTPAYHQPPKSTRLKPGAELVTDIGELKKMYRDFDEVGKGGFGTVFYAKSVKERGKMVAIKKMPHSTRKQKSSNFHEVSIMNACNQPNIVKFYTCHEIKDELWIAMEYLEGGTFEEAARAWNFNEANLAYVARELLKGISYMHANQFAHRDLKSANIMMSVQGEVKLIDFGLCADMSTGFPRHMVGSPFWMPPEMIQGKPHTYAVDIWSFAISLLEMANQRPPMIESAVKAMFTVATEGCTQMFIEPNKWSDTFKDFLGLCLKMDPEERATAEQLLHHPFIQLADTRSNMENILRRIFLSNSLLNSGFS